jgi:hypothetical protein
VQKYLRSDHGDHDCALVSFFLFTVSPIPWLVADALLTARYFLLAALNILGAPPAGISI